MTVHLSPLASPPVCLSLMTSFLCCTLVFLPVTPHLDEIDRHHYSMLLWKDWAMFCKGLKADLTPFRTVSSRRGFTVLILVKPEKNIKFFFFLFKKLSLIWGRRVLSCTADSVFLFFWLQAVHWKKQALVPEGFVKCLFSWKWNMSLRVRIKAGCRVDLEPSLHGLSIERESGQHCTGGK